MRRTATILGVLVLALGTWVSAAAAQTATTNYPGTTTPTTAGLTSCNVAGSTLSQGQSFTAEEPGFLANATLALVLNGAGAGTDTANSSGVGNQAISVVSGGTALGVRQFAAIGLQLAATAPVVSIEGRQYNAILGANTLVVSGTGANAAARTCTVTFTVSRVSGGGLVRTGVKIVGMTAVGLALVAGGFLLVGATRRRRHPATPAV